MDFKNFMGNIAKTFLVVGALSVSAYAGADDYNNMRSNCAPVYASNCAPMPACAPSCGTESCCCGQPCCEPPVCGWAYNPPGYCRCNNPANCCNDCDGFGLRLDFLWWRTCATGIALGTQEEYTSFATGTDRNSAINTSHLKKPDFKFDPGFRLGLISYCACGCWDIALNWTHYHTTAHANGYSYTTLGQQPSVSFISYWERGTGLNPDSTEARYSLNLDLLDLEFGRKYLVSSCFSLRPHFGLRAARINQDYKVFSESFGTSTSGVSTFGTDYTSTVKARNDFLAIGPRVGAELQVHLGCGFSLVGEAAGSLVYGRFNRHAKEEYIDYALSTDTDFINDFTYEAKSPSDRCSRAFTDLAVGFKWERCFDWCGRLHPVGIAFTWEHHAFFNMSNFNFASRGINIESAIETPPVAAPSYSATGGGAKTGDIYTQGLTVSATFGF